MLRKNFESGYHRFFMERERPGCELCMGQIVAHGVVRWKINVRCLRASKSLYQYWASGKRCPYSLTYHNGRYMCVVTLNWCHWSLDSPENAPASSHCASVFERLQGANDRARPKKVRKDCSVLLEPLLQSPYISEGRGSVRVNLSLT